MKRFLAILRVVEKRALGFGPFGLVSLAGGFALAIRSVSTRLASERDTARRRTPVAQWIICVMHLAHSRNPLCAALTASQCG
jgi:hypothetical protein